MPLMPIPPIPTKWILAGLERNSVIAFLSPRPPRRRARRLARLPHGRAPAPAHELGADVGDLLCGLRAPQPPRGPRHALPALRRREDGPDLVREKLPGEVALLDHDRRAR